MSYRIEKRTGIQAIFTLMSSDNTYWSPSFEKEILWNPDLGLISILGEKLPIIDEIEIEVLVNETPNSL